MIERPTDGDQPWKVRRMAERAAADGVDWWTWRIVMSRYVPDGLAEIRYHWSFADLVEAHLALDVIEAAQPKPPER